MNEIAILSAKQRVEQVLKDLPDDCTLEDIQYQLYVMQVMENRLQQADKGEFASEDEVRQRMAKWLVK